MNCSILGCFKTSKSAGLCSMHYARLRRHGDPLIVKQIHGNPEQRFWQKVNKDGPMPSDHPGHGPCWLWTGAHKLGYGQLRLGGRPGYLVQAHRFAYDLLVGPIPEGLTLDHLCRTPACVNPAHLEPVTMRENVLRGTSPSAKNAHKTHCLRGHLLHDHARIDTRGQRECRICRRIANRAVSIARGSQPRSTPEGELMPLTHCPHGHAYSKDNTYTYHGYRQCRLCHRLKERHRQQRLRSRTPSS